MAHHKSSKKRIRQTITRTARNKAQTSETRTAIKKLKLAISSANKDEAATLLLSTQSKLAKLAKKGVIKPNKAARTTSRLTKQVNAL